MCSVCYLFPYFSGPGASHIRCCTNPLICSQGSLYAMLDISSVAFHYLLSQMPDLLCSQPQTRGNPTASSSLDLPPVPALQSHPGCFGEFADVALGLLSQKWFLPAKELPPSPPELAWVARPSIKHCWLALPTLSALGCSNTPITIPPARLFLCTTIETLVSIHTDLITPNVYICSMLVLWLFSVYQNSTVTDWYQLERIQTNLLTMFRANILKSSEFIKTYFSFIPLDFINK